MSKPKHRSHLGASYFVTTKCWQSRAIFQLPENAEILIDILFQYRKQGAYFLHEFVVMPDHFHVILTPGLATSLERAVQLIKGGCSHRIHKARNHAMEIWQQGFHDWTIRDADDWHGKAEYVAMNPVRAGLVQTFRGWPYSSASGKFDLDPMPERFSKSSSGAKAPTLVPSTPGLKPRPPKEEATSQNARAHSPGQSGLSHRGSGA
jgi:putative transposase